jgi:hypothetical protein
MIQIYGGGVITLKQTCIRRCWLAIKGPPFLALLPRQGRWRGGLLAPKRPAGGRILLLPWISAHDVDVDGISLDLSASWMGRKGQHEGLMLCRRCS